MPPRPENRPEDNMPRLSQFVPLVIRLAVYVTAIVVVATARLPGAAAPSHPAIQRTAERAAARRPAVPPSPIRILIGATLLAGFALDVRGRRPVWR
jgi:hypothetical protein